MEKKTKTASKNMDDKDINPPKANSATKKLLKKKNGTEAKIYGKGGGKGG